MVTIAIVVFIIGIICAFVHKEGCLVTICCTVLSFILLVAPDINEIDITSKTQITVSTDEKVFVTYQDKKLEIWRHENPKDFYYLKSNNHKIILYKYKSLMFGEFEELKIK